MQQKLLISSGSLLIDLLLHPWKDISYFKAIRVACNNVNQTGSVVKYKLQLLQKSRITLITTSFLGTRKN